jgi:NTP pyrophosphatase (non-canonical NTP hydrolase)
MKYEVQSGESIDGLRITDTETDSRVATCYAPENAKLVCDALNEAETARQRRTVVLGMSANDYQKAALRTESTPNFVDTEDPQLARMLHAALGVCTESGELQDMLKKHLIYGKDFDPINVIEECGDVLWYLALALDATGFSLQDCMERNIAKLRKRFPDRFTSEKALVRDLDAERAALQKPVGHGG